MSRSGITLRMPFPSKASVRCAANKRYAAATVAPDGTMKVLLRTDSGDTLVKKGRREATRLGRRLYAFRLTDGTYLGVLYPKGQGSNK